MNLTALMKCSVPMYIIYAETYVVIVGLLGVSKANKVLIVLDLGMEI